MRNKPSPLTTPIAAKTAIYIYIDYIDFQWGFKNESKSKENKETRKIEIANIYAFQYILFLLKSIY